MASIVDERGYNQGFVETPASVVRLKRRARAIAEEMQPSTDGTTPVNILEIGSGTGEMALLLAQLTGARVTGVDLSQRFVEEARAKHRHPNLQFIVADLTKDTPKTDADRYQYIVGNGILHHLYHHLDVFLPALKCWLAPGGRLIFWEPNLWNPYIFCIFSLPPLRRLAKLEPDEMAFTASFITKKLRNAGFGPVKVVLRDFLLPNTPARFIKSVITVGDRFEKIPVVKQLSQSVFITATLP